MTDHLDDTVDITAAHRDLARAEMRQAGRDLAQLHIKADEQRIKLQQAINDLRHTDVAVEHAKTRYAAAARQYRQSIGECILSQNDRPIYSYLLSGKPYDNEFVCAINEAAKRNRGNDEAAKRNRGNDEEPSATSSPKPQLKRLHAFTDSVLSDK